MGKGSKLNAVIRDWLRKNELEGIIKFDFKHKDIIFYDGGIVAIKKTIRKQKGVSTTLTDFSATMWFEEIDDAIDTLKKAKLFLHNNGHITTNNV